MIEGQTRSKLSRNNIFHSVTSNPSFSETFDNFGSKLILGGPKNPNFDPAIKTGWNQRHCKDYQILAPTTIHGSESELERQRYQENRDDSPIDAPRTSESCNFLSNFWIFKIHTFSEIGCQDLCHLVMHAETINSLDTSQTKEEHIFLIFCSLPGSFTHFLSL